jgi:hypothetical protein
MKRLLVMLMMVRSLSACWPWVACCATTPEERLATAQYKILRAIDDYDVNNFDLVVREYEKYVPRHEQLKLLYSVVMYSKQVAGHSVTARSEHTQSLITLGFGTPQRNPAGECSERDRKLYNDVWDMLCIRSDLYSLHELIKKGLRITDITYPGSAVCNMMGLCKERGDNKTKDVAFCNTVDLLCGQGFAIDTELSLAPSISVPAHTTVLQQAIEYGRPAWVAYLLSKGADSAAQDALQKKSGQEQISALGQDRMKEIEIYRQGRALYGQALTQVHTLLNAVLLRELSALVFDYWLNAPVVPVATPTTCVSTHNG